MDHVRKCKHRQSTNIDVTVGKSTIVWDTNSITFDLDCLESKLKDVTMEIDENEPTKPTESELTTKPTSKSLNLNKKQVSIQFTVNQTQKSIVYQTSSPKHEKSQIELSVLSNLHWLAEPLKTHFENEATKAKGVLVHLPQGLTDFDFIEIKPAGANGMHEIIAIHMGGQNKLKIDFKKLRHKLIYFNNMEEWWVISGEKLDGSREMNAEVLWQQNFEVRSTGEIIQ